MFDGRLVGAALVLAMMTSADPIQGRECPSNCDCSRNLQQDQYICKLSSGNVTLTVSTDTADVSCAQSHYQCSELPQIQHKVSNLIIRGCDLLPETLFCTHDTMALTQITALIIQDAELTDITDKMFQGLESLKHLQLLSTKLGPLPLNFFSRTRFLQSIVIENSSVEYLESGLFARLEQLEQVLIRNNSVQLKLGGRAFSELRRLQSLQLIQCGIEEVPGELVADSRNLKYLSLAQNRLTKIPSELFLDLQQLKKLDLSGNMIKIITGDLFIDLVEVQDILLDNNHIEELPSSVFVGLKNAREISICDNHLKRIDERAFMEGQGVGAGAIQKLRLAGNQLSLTSLQPFRHLRLTHLDLSRNNFTDDDLCLQLPFELKNLNLSYNHISSIKDDYYWNKNILIDFRFNRIATVYVSAKPPVSADFTPRMAQILLDGNMLQCNCTLLRFIKALSLPRTHAAPEQPLYDVGTASCTDGRFLRDLAPRDLHCAPLAATCPPSCNCTLNATDPHPLHIDCLNVPTDLDFDRLEYDAITLRLRRVPPPGALEHLSLKVFRLYLTHLNITEIPSLPPKLPELDLTYSNVVIPPVSVLTSSWTKVYLAGNPLSCDCNHIDGVVGLQQHKHRILDLPKVRCARGELLEHVDTRSCVEVLEESQPVWPNVVAVLVTLALAISAVSLLYRYAREIKVYLYARGWLWWLKQDGMDCDKIYDAFVSFSHLDVEFVVDELVPRLERGPVPLKLCLHYRDWIIGELIPTQIIRSIVHSRRTIVVLSRNFLSSVWAQEEFRMAHASALRDGCSRVVVIMLEDVTGDPRLGDDLRAYLNTSTYIKRDDPRLWERLRYALPHRRRYASKKSCSKENLIHR